MTKILIIMIVINLKRQNFFYNGFVLASRITSDYKKNTNTTTTCLGRLCLGRVFGAKRL